MSADSSRFSAHGALFGLALGDALGAVTEFSSVPQILLRFPPDGPQEPKGDPALVTDDTQMALCVGEALVAQLGASLVDVSALENAFRAEFLKWYRSPDNNRAPGRT